MDSYATLTNPPTSDDTWAGLIANAVFTVFLDTPITRAISVIGIGSARRGRRTSAQSSTLSTRFLPARFKARSWEAGQFSVAVSWSVFGCR